MKAAAPGLRVGVVAALTSGHVAGMIDLAALPVWVGVALMGRYGLAPSVAGGMVSLYLVCVVLASLLLSRVSAGGHGRLGACLGFGVAALAFAALAQTSALPWLFAGHAVAGFAAGAGLTFVHAAMGRTANPHRVFAIAQGGLGVSAVLFMGLGPALIGAFGGPVLFVLFALLMVVALLGNLLAHPAAVTAAATSIVRAPVPVAARWIMLGVTLMGLVQAGLFSFVERIGLEHGFGARVNAVLIAVGLVNLLPPALAALLQRRLHAHRVSLAGPLVQAGLALSIVLSHDFVVYAVATPLFISSMVFTHTYMFGWMARLDPSGRAVSLTPAVLMSGAAVGPVLCGALVQLAGYRAMVAVLVVISLMAGLAYAMARRAERH